jgi:hypothetical protein
MPATTDATAGWRSGNCSAAAGRRVPPVIACSTCSLVWVVHVHDVDPGDAEPAEACLEAAEHAVSAEVKAPHQVVRHREAPAVFSLTITRGVLLRIDRTATRLIARLLDAGQRVCLNLRAARRVFVPFEAGVDRLQLSSLLDQAVIGGEPDQVEQIDVVIGDCNRL